MESEEVTFDNKGYERIHKITIPFNLILNPIILIAIMMYGLYPYWQWFFFYTSFAVVIYLFFIYVYFFRKLKRWGLPRKFIISKEKINIFYKTSTKNLLWTDVVVIIDQPYSTYLVKPKIMILKNNEIVSLGFVDYTIVKEIVRRFEEIKC